MHLFVSLHRIKGGTQQTRRIGNAPYVTPITELCELMRATEIVNCGLRGRNHAADGGFRRLRGLWGQKGSLANWSPVDANARAREPPQIVLNSHSPHLPLN